MTLGRARRTTEFPVCFGMSSGGLHVSHVGTLTRCGGVESPLALRSGKPNLCVHVVGDVDGVYDGSVGAYYPLTLTLTLAQDVPRLNQISLINRHT